MADAQLMGKNVMGGQQMGVMFPSKGSKFGKVRDGKVGEAVREVIIRAMCNYSTTANNIPTSTEFNISASNDTHFNICEQCFLATPINEIFTESGGQNASACTRDYLPRRFHPCAAGIIYGNTSTEEISECYKDALKNTTIEFCSNSTNSSDPAERFQIISSCLRQNKREFKKEVRMVMMDKVIGGSGCSFSALIALKLFGDKKRSSIKKDMDFEEALDDMLEDELDDDELEKPFQWTKDRPRWRGNNSIKQGGPKGWNKGVNNGDNGEYNREGNRMQIKRRNKDGGSFNKNFRGGVRGRGMKRRGQEMNFRSNNGRRGQSGGRQNDPEEGFQFNGGNKQIGGRFGSREKDELGSQYGEYDYDNDYSNDGDQKRKGMGRGSQGGGRGQSRRGQGQGNSGRGQGMLNNRRNKNKGQGFGGQIMQGKRSFGLNEVGEDYDNNYDNYDYGNNGDNDYDYEEKNNFVIE